MSHRGDEAPGDEAIERAWKAGRAAHPDIDLPLATFADFLNDRAWDRGDPARGPELYLVCACLARQGRAVELFMSAHIHPIPRFLGKRVHADLANDVQQQLAVRLLVGERARPPLLSTFTGRGSLEGFVRVTATRLAVDLRRNDARQPLPVGSVEDNVSEDDLELKLLKDSYREPFRAAFAAALAELAPEHRALLRLHYVEGATTEGLARLRGVGRATIVRRLGAAREALVAAVQKQLERAIERSEFQGFLHLVRSQLDLSLARLLRESFTGSP